MKRKLVLLLATFMCISLCACAGSKKSIITEYDGQPAIERERFGELLEVVELTTENWREHFKIVTYEEDSVSYDAFGELIKDENGNVVHEYIPHTMLVAKTDSYFYFNNVVIELAKNGTDELITYEIRGQGVEIFETMNLDDYSCTRVIGEIILVNLPVEAVCTPLEEWGYECGFQLEGNGCTPYEINKYTKGIHRNGSACWVEQFIEK